MKYLLIVALLATVGCSSNSKKEEKKAEEPKKQETVVEEGAEDSSEDTEESKASTKEKKSGNQTTNLNADDEGSDTDGFAPVEGEVTLTISCKQNQDERTMKVTRAEGKTPLCGVAYEKFGKTKTVAIANNDENFCSQVANQIKDSLTSANFECSGGSEAAPDQEESVKKIEKKAKDAKAKTSATSKKVTEEEKD